MEMPVQGGRGELDHGGLLARVHSGASSTSSVAWRCWANASVVSNDGKTPGATAREELAILVGATL